MDTKIEDMNKEELEEVSKQITTQRKKFKYQKKGVYRGKENSLRYFSPEEFEKFVYDVAHSQRFHFWFLLLTGLRYNEAKHVKYGDIDFREKYLIVMKPKGGLKRYCQLSSYAIILIKSYKRECNLKSEDTFGFSSIQNLNDSLKRICKKVNLKQWRDFSVHSLRKTHENYLMAIHKEESQITKHMGHTYETAQKHYLSSAFIKDKKRLMKIEKWLGDIF